MSAIKSRLSMFYRVARRERRLLVFVFVIGFVLYTITSIRNDTGFKANRGSATGGGSRLKKENSILYQDQLKKLQSTFGDDNKLYFQDTNENIDSNIKKINEYLFKNSELSSDDIEKLKLATENSLPFDKSHMGTLHKTMSEIFNIYKEHAPKCENLVNYKSDERIYHAGYDTRVDRDKDPIFSEYYLKQFLSLTDDELTDMKQNHANVVDKLPNEKPPGIFKGNGIVYVGGGNFNWLVMLSIKTLRYLGSELPVEVIIPTIEEYELDLCGRIFPALGARCILLPQVLGEDVVKQFTFFGYQYKALALLASSFENVLLLDSDNVPAMKPDYLFESEPYTSNGLICWPDFWKRATSPFFYDIAGVTVGEKRISYGYHKYGIYESGISWEHEVRDQVAKFGVKDHNMLNYIPLHDREGAIPDPTTESGQLLLSKNTHWKSLLLALYYNLYGPSHYYPLFSQGSDGEGDKETFLAAAVVLKKPFYQVNKFLTALGHYDEERNFIGCGMGQFDPVEDYKILSKNLEILSNFDEKFYSYEAANEEINSNEQVKEKYKEDLPLKSKIPNILFIHANFPKLNPMELRNKGILFDKKGDRIRLYGEGLPKRVGYDFELVQWQSMYSLVCDLKMSIEVFNKFERSEVCDEISQQLKFLKESVDTLDT